MIINLYSDPRHRIPKRKLQQAVVNQLNSKKISGNYILNIAFVGRRKMKSIALQYHKSSEALPVLSFSYLDEKHDEEKLLGEIIICYPLAVLLAAQRDRSVFETILKLIDHGIETIVA